MPAIRQPWNTLESDEHASGTTIKGEDGEKLSFVVLPNGLPLNPRGRMGMAGRGLVTSTLYAFALFYFAYFSQNSSPLRPESRGGDGVGGQGQVSIRTQQWNDTGAAVPSLVSVRYGTLLITFYLAISIGCIPMFIQPQYGLPIELVSRSESQVGGWTMVVARDAIAKMINRLQCRSLRLVR